MITVVITLKMFIIGILLYFLAIFLIKYISYLIILKQNYSLNFKNIKRFKFYHFINRYRLEKLVESISEEYTIKSTTLKFKRYRKLKNLM